MHAAAGITWLPDTLSGSTDMPSPLIESWSWQAHQQGQFAYEGPDSVGALIVANRQPFIDLDMHTSSMRKQNGIRNELKLVGQQTNSATVAVTMTFQLRILLLLP